MTSQRTIHLIFLASMAAVAIGLRARAGLPRIYPGLLIVAAFEAGHFFA
jgi:hypothetical protein